MKIRSKKQNADGIVRVETSGEVREVLLQEDFLKPNEASVAICYKGKDSSGIINFTPQEMESIIKQISSKLDLFKGIKIMRFDK